MSLTWKMAIRNLIRHRRRTVITVASIAIGLGIVFWLQSILNGTTNAAIQKVTGLQFGRVQVMHPRFFDERSVMWTIPDFETHASQIQLNPAVSTSPRVYMPALASGAENSIPIQLMGIDPLVESRVTTIHRMLAEGEWLTPSPADCPEFKVVIGRELGKSLQLQVGDKLVIMGQDANVTLATELARVAGIYDTGSRDFDRVQAYATIECVRKLASVTGVHETVFAFQDAELEDALVADLRRVYGDTARVTTWREALPRLNSVVRSNAMIFVMISAMLLVVVVLGILNTFLVSVFERTREFGVMRALGVNRKAIIAIVLAEGVCTAVVSVALAGVLGFLAIFYHTKMGFDLGLIMGKEGGLVNFKIDSIIYPVVKMSSILWSALWAFVAVCLAGLYPALRASRMKPVDAIRGI